MLNIAVCDDSRTDVEMLESAFDKLAQYQFSYEVYFTAKELLKHVIDYGEMYHLYIFDMSSVQRRWWSRLMNCIRKSNSLKQKYRQKIILLVSLRHS